MLAGLFNRDMDRRLSDLHEAATAGVPITAKRLAPLGRQPDRVQVTAGARVLVFLVPMAGPVADQLAANGHAEASEAVRAALEG